MPTPPTIHRQPTYIGVDLHVNNFTACYLNDTKESVFQKFSLDKQGLADFIKTLKLTDAVAVEAVSNAKFFSDHIEKYVSRVEVVATGQFYVISKSAKKTDKHDAEALALFLSKNMLPKARTRSEKHQNILSLIETRQQLVMMRRNLINRSHSVLHRQGISLGKRQLLSLCAFDKRVFTQNLQPISELELRHLHAQITHLTLSLKQLEKDIESLAKSLPGYENLLSLKGIAPLSAATLLCIIGNINDFSNPNKLSSYFGIVPKVRSSNDRNVASRITRHGSRLGRSTLYLCTVVGKQHNPYLQDYFLRIKKNRGGGKAMIATSRKYLKIIYDTLKNDWVFEDFSQYRYRKRTQN